jgi:hypothetical protein
MKYTIQSKIVSLGMNYDFNPINFVKSTSPLVKM